MPPQSFNPYLRGGDTPRRRSRRSRDPFAVNAFVNQADDARAAETADPDADPDDCAGFRDEDRRTPDFEEPEDYGEGLPEDSELAIPHNIIVPDRLKFAKRLQLYEDRIRPNPVTGESKVIKGAWNLLYEAWGLGSKHIHVMERIGIDEALICPRVEQIPDAEVPHRAVQTTATVYPGGQKVEGPWYKPWAWGPFDWMKAIGFTSWTSRGGIAHKRRTLPKELGEDDGWRPPRIGVFKEWPGEEEEDVWFKNTYNHLFLRVESFTKKYFDLGDIDPHQYHGRYVWLEDLPNELLGFAKAAARQDNLVGGWDGLLTVSTYRRCLVMAIFAKVLEKYVFDELLFGGRKDQFLMLSSQDESLVGLEGYQRSDLRARTVRATLRNKTLTPFFWACVDRVSMQIMTLLTPLVLVLDKHFPDSNLNSLRSMHQDIHAIVAQAGYFQIGTAWSHDIFRYSWPFLGQTWDLEQVHYDGGPWELSSARSLQANQKAWNQYTAAFNEAKKLDEKREKALEEIETAERARRRSSLAVLNNVQNLSDSAVRAQNKARDKWATWAKLVEESKRKAAGRREGRFARGVNSPPRRRSSPPEAPGSSDDGAVPAPAAAPQAAQRRRPSDLELQRLIGEVIKANRATQQAADELQTANMVEEAAIKAMQVPQERNLADVKSKQRRNNYELELVELRLNEADTLGYDEARKSALRGEKKKFEDRAKVLEQDLARATRIAAKRVKILGNERLEQANRAADAAKRRARQLARQPPAPWSWAWLKTIPGAALLWFARLVVAILKITWGVVSKFLNLFIKFFVGTWKAFAYIFTTRAMVWLGNCFVHYIWDTEPVLLVREYTTKLAYAIGATLYGVWWITSRLVVLVCSVAKGAVSWFFSVPPFNWIRDSLGCILSLIKRLAVWFWMWTAVVPWTFAVRFRNWCSPHRDTTLDPVSWPVTPIQTPRLAKVQMVLWPQLQRYSPLGPLDPTTGVCKEGETIVTLSKSQVIYYAGRSDPGREALEARPPLEEHVKDRRRQRIKAWVWPLSYIFSTFLCLLFLHWLGQKFYPPLDRFLTWAEHFFFNLGRTVVLLTAVVILNLVMWFLQVLVTWMKLIFWLAYAFRNLLARLVGAQLSGPASGFQFAPGGWRIPRIDFGTWSLAWPEPEPAETTAAWGESPWEVAGLRYPEFSFRTVVRLTKMFYKEVDITWRTKTVTLNLTYPLFRMFAPLLHLRAPAQGTE